MKTLLLWPPSAFCSACPYLKPEHQQTTVVLAAIEDARESDAWITPDEEEDLTTVADWVRRQSPVCWPGAAMLDYHEADTWVTEFWLSAERPESDERPVADPFCSLSADVAWSRGSSESAAEMICVSRRIGDGEESFSSNYFRVVRTSDGATLLAMWQPTTRELGPGDTMQLQGEMRLGLA